MLNGFIYFNKSIFEAGCGPGILIPYILINKKIGS